MRLLLLLALLVAPTAAGGNLPTPALDAVASEVAGKPVTVWCEGSLAEWEAMNEQRGYRYGSMFGGFTYLESPVVYIGPEECATLRVALESGVPVAGAYWFAGALLTLAHESVHQRGIRDEQIADCTALALVPGLTVSRFGVSETTVERRAQPFTRTVVRRVRGVAVRIKVQDVRVMSVVIPNPLVAHVKQWAAAWHGLLGPPC